jgi:hypothetical protein
VPGFRKLESLAPMLADEPVDLDMIANAGEGLATMHQARGDLRCVVLPGTSSK